MPGPVHVNLEELAVEAGSRIRSLELAGEGNSAVPSHPRRRFPSQWPGQMLVITNVRFLLTSSTRAPVASSLPAAFGRGERGARAQNGRKPPRTGGRRTAEGERARAGACSQKALETE